MNQPKQVQYLARPVTATQWLKPGDYATENDIYPTLKFSRDKTYFYMSHPLLNPKCWIAVKDTNGEEAPMLLPFAFWKVNSGETIDLNISSGLEGVSEEYQRLIRRALKECNYDEKNIDKLKPYGVLRREAYNYYEDGPRARDKTTRIVSHGDWIVEDAFGNLSVYSEGYFKSMFSVVE